MTEVVYLKGDLFKSRCDILVNPVNCRSTMGAGLALAFKTAYAGTSMFGFYLEACRTKELAIGRPILWDGKEYGYPSVLLFTTKDDWRHPSRIKYITSGLMAMAHMDFQGSSMAFPMLGSGLGGLDYVTQVKPSMDALLPLLTTLSRIEVYE